MNDNWKNAIYVKLISEIYVPNNYENVETGVSFSDNLIEIVFCRCTFRIYFSAEAFHVIY